MKANESPEKLYVHRSQHWGLMANEHNITKNGIEYIRTDAFIEKASWWIEENIRKWFKNMNTHGYKMTELMIEDFKKAMKL